MLSLFQLVYQKARLISLPFFGIKLFCNVNIYIVIKILCFLSIFSLDSGVETDEGSRSNR